MRCYVSSNNFPSFQLRLKCCVNERKLIIIIICKVKYKYKLHGVYISAADDFFFKANDKEIVKYLFSMLY